MNKSNNSGGTFASLGLDPWLLKGINHMGWRLPTPVQRKSLPVCLAGGDAVVMARTGSGKTGAFVIPMLHMLSSSSSANKGARAVILSPTRELCLQTLQVTRKLGKHAPQQLNSISIIGGDSMGKQFAALASHPDIIVATPGRLAHHLSEIPDFDLKDCEILIFDEADRLFEMGFAAQIREICKTIPEARQTLLFSATMPKMLAEFARSGLTDPTVVRLDSEATVSAELRIGFFTCRSNDKDAALLYLLRNTYYNKNNSNEDNSKKLTLVFAATRHHAEYLTSLVKSSGISATTIYGTMDQEARKVNLTSFRKGETPVLVVTDVAARGIDVPLIDFVIHHSFPASHKLFVHRSGRAARAGRIGYAFALVEPDEMPFMVDLHLFLGRKLSNGQRIDSQGGDDDKHDVIESYSLIDMTPEMIHYGSVPESIITEEVENVRRLLENESGNKDAESLKSMAKVCTNAMKQYRRSRPEPSKSGVRRAKEIMDKGPIPRHPLLIHLENIHLKELSERGGNVDTDLIKKRDDFLLAMANFRPQETIFEALAKSGGSKKAGQVDKSRNTGTIEGDTQDIMKAMRRQVKLARDKNAMVVAGSEDALAINGELVEQEQRDENDYIADIASAKAQPGKVVVGQKAIESSKTVSNNSAPKQQSKRHMSKAERKRLKKYGSIDSEQQNNKTNTNAIDELLLQSSSVSGYDMNVKSKLKAMRGVDFRDGANFIGFEQTFDSRQRTVEASMQPSAAEGKDVRAATMKLEEAMLDIVGDENADLVKRHRLMRWDKSKRKYIQTTIGSELSGDSKSKKLRLESGQLVKSDKLKLGEIYEKWQKKTKKSIGRQGVFDDEEGVGNEDSVSPPNTSSQGEGGKKKKGGKNNAASGADDTRKSIAQIKKERAQKANMKLKNMPRAERKKIEQKNRQERMKKALAKTTTARWNGKRK